MTDKLLLGTFIGVAGIGVAAGAVMQWLDDLKREADMAEIESKRYARLKRQYDELKEMCDIVMNEAIND